MSLDKQQVVLNIRFKTKPGKKEEFRTQLSSLIQVMSVEKAFISAILSDDLDQPNDLVIYEIWEGTRESWLQEEFTKPYRKEYEGTLGELIEDRMVSWLEPKGEWGSTLRAK
ncbi:antibiotic biosynthesis monooxygenase [Paenibacillus sp. CGMCC 1.16610]|uniref:Antibiotic biosynthesis monooxygenase n=1 Tax=Paenibacillus anseongense TaxID=2682845 RepID=A0ABW9ULB7_9BACL|nr:MULTISPECIES: antibiotic biosynthesis monooxygenase [Paenibacillus]MBA2939634.1 antibiotic biosynthesis monooxygenase [Paenibacillus sp. CGMCC 1.16610]MVQ39295.1 antibiotic biosynthesis monooxygenase [Paenibacillus anseongense]